MQNRVLRLFLMSALFAAGTACADEGFYGGLSVRPNGSDASTEAAPFALGGLPSAWTKLTPGLKSETAGGALLYGGYRFQKAPVGLEAAISNTADASHLGLRLDPRGLGFYPYDTTPRNWNIDVFTNLAVNRSLGLYGRMGYGYNDALRNGTTSLSNLASQDSVLRKTRDGFNYGVGMRYDMNQSLGLRLEYSRFARIGTDAYNSIPPADSDQLSIGFQYRF